MSQCRPPGLSATFQIPLGTRQDAVLAPLVIRASRRRAVVMVQPAEHRHGDDPARITAGFAWRRNRNALAEPLMRARRVVISETVLVEHALHVPLTVNDHVIEGFAPHASKKTLAHGVHQRRLDRRADHLRADTLRHTVKLSAKLVVPVPDDELITLITCDPPWDTSHRLIIQGRLTGASVATAPV